MPSRTNRLNFSYGQRVKVIVLGSNDEPINHLPSHYLKYNGRIGYISSLKDTLAGNGKRGENQSLRFEVFITKLGIIIELPEDCLESAEYRRSSL
jgi:hypothetical protein